MADRIRALVRGRVQGVGFRDFVERRASALGLQGTVRNRPDGTVEVVAEGDRARLDSLLREVRVGPRLARVEEVDVEREAARGEFPDFRVTY